MIGGAAMRPSSRSTARCWSACRDRERHEDFVTVPVQGSGTFAVEAMLTSLVPAKGRVLV